MKFYGRTLDYLALSALLLAACAFQPTSAVAQMTSVGIDCSQIQPLGLLKQDNLGAGRVLIECGVMEGGHADKTSRLPLTPPVIANVQVSNRSCSSASTCTKSENMVFGNTSNPLNIVDNYNDNNGSSSYTGTSYSNDGGTTFTEISPAPFTNGHGENLGDPLVVYNTKLGEFFLRVTWRQVAVDLASGCGVLRTARLGPQQRALTTAAVTIARRCGWTTSRPAEPTDACTFRGTTLLSALVPFR